MCKVNVSWFIFPSDKYISMLRAMDAELLGCFRNLYPLQPFGAFNSQRFL